VDVVARVGVEAGEQRRDELVLVADRQRRVDPALLADRRGLRAGVILSVPAVTVDGDRGAEAAEPVGRQDDRVVVEQVC
jgi:hypothetical protein